MNEANYNKQKMESSIDLNEWLIKKIKGLERPFIVIEIVLFTHYKDKLCVILVSKDIDWKTQYVLPWWSVSGWYSLEDNFDDILYRKTGIKWVYKEQIGTFSEVNRKKNSDQIISVAFFALINKNIFLNEVDLTKISIIEYNNIDNIIIWYGHDKIIKFAKQRLNFRLEYTTVSKDILPPMFTLPQIQKMYETIFWETFDKRNFRRKVIQYNIVRFTWKYDKLNSNRPAKLYEFVDKELQNVNKDIINL